VSAEVRKEWVCSECAVRVYAPGKKTTAPKGWDRKNDRCLACKKKATRLESDEPKGWHDTKKPTNGDLPRQAVERAEAALRADDQRSDADIAKATSTSRKVVAITRARLDLPKFDKRKQRTSATTKKIEALLKADPKRSNREVGDEVKASASRVRVVRREMGIPAPKLDGRGRPIR
jgi:hypothetical protein